MKRAYASLKAINDAQYFTPDEIKELEKNNKKEGSWSTELRKRVLSPFILPVYRDFSGAFLTEKDRERDDFNRRFKRAVIQGDQEAVKNISREFTERIAPEVSILYDILKQYVEGLNN